MKSQVAQPALILLAFAAPVLAQPATFRWTPDFYIIHCDGDLCFYGAPYSTSSNWQYISGVGFPRTGPPTAIDTALFHDEGGDVLLFGSHATGQLLLAEGIDVSFDLGDEGVFSALSLMHVAGNLSSIGGTMNLPGTTLVSGSGSWTVSSSMLQSSMVIAASLAIVGDEDQVASVFLHEPFAEAQIGSLTLGLKGGLSIQESTLKVVDVQVASTGSLSLVGGTITVVGNFTTQQPLLILDGYSPTDRTGELRAESSSHLDINSAALVVGDLNRATMRIDEASEADVAGITILGVAEGARGDMVLQGTSTWTNGGDVVVGRAGDGFVSIQQASGADLTNDLMIAQLDGSNGQVTVDSTSYLAVGGSIAVGDAGTATLTISGSSYVSCEGISLGADSAGFGNVTLKGGSTLFVDGNISVGGNDDAPGGEGLFTVREGATLDSNNNGFVHPGGDLIIDGGSVQMPGALVVSGGAGVQFHDGLLYAGGITTVNEFGFYFGNGRLGFNYFDGDLRQQGGTLGHAFQINAATITGNYFNTSVFGDGELEIELSTSGFDTLTVDGTTFLDGVLSVSLLDGFVPSAGSEFEFLTSAGLITGDFEAVNLPPLPADLTWELDILSHSIVLSVASMSGPGDFDNDGDVDAADYVVWRKGLGTTYTQDDFNTWRANFGATLGSGSGGTGSASGPAIPEPTSELLFLSFAAIAVWSQRHRSTNAVRARKTRPQIVDT